MVVLVGMLVNEMEYDMVKIQKQELLTLTDERDTKVETRKHKVYWSFRDMETRHSLIWEAEGDS